MSISQTRPLQKKKKIYIAAFWGETDTSDDGWSCDFLKMDAVKFVHIYCVCVSECMCMQTSVCACVCLNGASLLQLSILG